MLSEEIVTDARSSWNGGAVGKIKVVGSIDMHIFNVGGDVFHLLPIVELAERAARHAVHQISSGIEAETRAPEILRTLVTAAVVAVILQEEVTACGSRSLSFVGSSSYAARSPAGGKGEKGSSFAPLSRKFFAVSRNRISMYILL